MECQQWTWLTWTAEGTAEHQSAKRQWRRYFLALVASEGWQAYHWCGQNDSVRTRIALLCSEPTEVDGWDRLEDQPKYRCRHPAGWEPKQQQATERHAPRQDGGCYIADAALQNSATSSDLHVFISPGLNQCRCQGHRQRKREGLSE